MYKYFLMSDDGLELGQFETVADTLKFIYEAYEDDNIKALSLQGDELTVITNHYNLNMIIKKEIEEIRELQKQSLQNYIKYYKTEKL